MFNPSALGILVDFLEGSRGENKDFKSGWTIIFLSRLFKKLNNLMQHWLSRIWPILESPWIKNQEVKLNAEELTIGLLINWDCLLNIKPILLESKLCSSLLPIQVKPVLAATMFTQLKVNPIATAKFLSVGIVVLNMMLTWMRLMLLLLWGLRL